MTVEIVSNPVSGEPILIFDEWPLPYNAKPEEISHNDERLWRARLELAGETDASLQRPELSTLPDYVAGYRHMRRLIDRAAG